jgi:hypothetical protein
MIKSVTQSGRYTQVSNGNASTYVNGYSGAQGIGNMRFNTTSQSIEVFDGNNWITLNMSYATVGLTGEAESLLDWARQKKDEELRLQEMIKKYPGLKKAKENFDLVLNIVKDDYK